MWFRFVVVHVLLPEKRALYFIFKVLTTFVVRGDVARDRFGHRTPNVTELFEVGLVL